MAQNKRRRREQGGAVQIFEGNALSEPANGDLLQPSVHELFCRSHRHGTGGAGRRFGRVRRVFTDEFIGLQNALYPLCTIDPPRRSADYLLQKRLVTYDMTRRKGRHKVLRYVRELEDARKSPCFEEAQNLNGVVVDIEKLLQSNVVTRCEINMLLDLAACVRWEERRTRKLKRARKKGGTAI